MTEIERLEELRSKQRELGEAWKAQRKIVRKKIYEILTKLNEGSGVDLASFNEEGYCYIDDTDWPHKEGFKWKVSHQVYFKNTDPDYPNRTYDFGSSFDLYISNLEITVNHGSCGTWGKGDPAQLARLKLIVAIFEHEKDIIDELDPLINLQVCKDLTAINCEIDKINWAIQDAKRRTERAEYLKLLVPGKYLAVVGKSWRYEENSSKQVRYYYGFEKIRKVTEKSILTDDDYGYSYRRDLDTYINKIRNGYVHIVDNKDATPPEVGESDE